MANDKILSLEEFAKLEARARAGDEEAKDRLYRDYHRTPAADRGQKLFVILTGRLPRLPQA